jgi:O-antigen ligase
MGAFFSLTTKWHRWLALVGSMIGLLTVLVSQKRGAYGLLIVLPCMAWFFGRRQTTIRPTATNKARKSWTIYAAFAILGAASLWSLQNTPLIQRPTNAIAVAIQEFKGSQKSLSDNYNTSVGARLYLWTKSVQAATESPWIGYGHDQRKALLQKWAHDTHLADPLIFGHVHNDYLHTLLDHGLWGLVSFLSYATGLMVLIFKLARHQSWASATTLGGILVMHLTTAFSNVNFAHNYYPTMLSLTICITLWTSVRPQTTKAP